MWGFIKNTLRFPLSANVIYSCQRQLSSSFQFPPTKFPFPKLVSSSSAALVQCPGSSEPRTMFGGALTVPSRGMKIKGRVKRRCKDCYLIWKDGILHNLCKTHGRHKQMQQPKYWANERLLTHATMSAKRPW